MLLSTTPTLEGGRIIRYNGIVTGEVILGANIFRDFFASIRDIVGGRAGSYETVLRDARNTAFQEMMSEAQRLGANAIVGIDLDYETLGKSMLMVRPPAPRSPWKWRSASRPRRRPASAGRCRPGASAEA